MSYADLSARDWALLVKAPDDYVGKAYVVWGCISQFDAATGADSFRAQAFFSKTTTWFTDGSNALFNGEKAVLAPFVKNDVVVMNVVVLGSYSYSTQSGGKTTVPNFAVITISNKGSC